MRRPVTMVALTLTCLWMFGCTRESTNSPISPSGAQRLAIENIASSAAASETQAARRPGAAPSSSGGPAITVSGNQRVINGGTQTVTVSGDTPFDTIFLFVAGRSLGLLGEAAGGVEGYYEIRLPGPQTSAAVLLTYPQNIPLAEFDLQFAVASAGRVGPYAGLLTSVTQVGTGDVQVTLSWDADADVDLHVLAPGGEEIYYGRRQSASGGTLDLDSNAGCQIDGIRNENITWPVGRAPRGPYTVKVDYWSNCGVSQTNYTVLVNNGGAVQIVSGSFTGAGDRGSIGSGRTVASFDRLSGPSAVVPTQPLTAGGFPGLSKTLAPGAAR